MAATSKRSPYSASSNLAVPAQQALLELFENQPHSLVTAFQHWLESKAFFSFVQNYQSKIRKKIKLCRDVEETYNLYCELRTAFLLLQDAKLAVAYEPYGLRDGRSADYAVTFRIHTIFHVEVTRLRTPRLELPGDEGERAPVEPVELVRRAVSRRLSDVICDKFGQLSPDTPNILWVWSERSGLQPADVDEVIVNLKRRAEQRDAELYGRHGFSKPADFTRFFQRVSVVLIQSLDAQPDQQAIIWWQNKDCKYPFPAKAATLLRTLIAMDRSPAFATDQGNT